MREVYPKKAKKRALLNFGNYIRVDTTTSDDKNYYINDNTDNNSASPTLLAAKGKCKSTTQTTCFNNLRGNQLPAALKESHVSVNGYIHPFKF